MRGVGWISIMIWRLFCCRVVLHRGPDCEQNSGGNTLATASASRTIISRKTNGNKRKHMTSRLETYRVSAYNTAKQSENKMHDDTVAKRFGFSGGLVPGVDALADMIHIPVAKWGRALLEGGLTRSR